MTYKECIADILFIVVLYKKKISECESIQSILTVLKGNHINFFVYDNSPAYNSNYTWNSKGVNIHYVGDNRNSGVSQAYNLGAKFAADRNKKWLLLCDQDTNFEGTYFNRLFEALQLYNPDLTAPCLYSKGILISPCSFRLNYGRGLNKTPLPGWKSLKHIALLNSGLIINRMTFDACGGYNERIFLDFSDFDFIKRYKKKYGNFYLLDVRLEHHLASSFQNNFNAQRFIKYCRSYRGAIHNLFDFITISSIVFARTVKLSINHRTFSPIGFWFRFFIMK